MRASFFRATTAALILMNVCLGVSAHPTFSSPAVNSGSGAQPFRPAPRAGLPDLSLRTSLYVTGTKTDTIDLGHDPYVANGQTMELKAADAVSNSGGYYTYNIGYLVFREGGQLSSPLNVFSELQFVGVTGNSFTFAANEQVRQQVFPVKLKPGPNTVTCVVDPEHKLAESNENNNSVTVTFNVKISSPPIRIPQKIDLTTTWELYLLHDQTSSVIDKKNDAIFGNTTSATLFQGKAMHCNPNSSPVVCGFKVAFVAVKKIRIDERAQSEYFVYDGDKKIYGAGMDLVEGVASMDVVFLLKLTPGNHDLKITLDPENQIAEQDETNNSIVVHLTVK